MPAGCGTPGPYSGVRIGRARGRGEAGACWGWGGGCDWGGAAAEEGTLGEMLGGLWGSRCEAVPGQEMGWGRWVALAEQPLAPSPR